MINYLIHNLWLSLLVISSIYILDHFMTYKNAKTHAATKDKYVIYEGGVELNPLFRKDINSLKKLNYKFIFILVLLNILFAICWFTSDLSHSFTTYELVAGGFILLELFVQVRHFENYFRYKYFSKKDYITVTSPMKYSRVYMHKISAIDALIFSCLYFIFYILSYQLFFLGGAIMCLLLAFQQNSWLKKYNREIRNNK